MLEGQAPLLSVHLRYNITFCGNKRRPHPESKPAAIRTRKRALTRREMCSPIRVDHCAAPDGH